MESSILPLVSVVIPCLNRKDYLLATLESIFQQDYPRIECIVVDGASTDGTRDLLQQLNGKVRWISEPDAGNADAINKGLRMSQGEVVTWLNADDLWIVPNAVSQVVKHLQSYPDVDLIYGDCGAIDAAGNFIGMSYLHDWDLEYAVTNCDHCIPQPACFIRRRVLEKVGWLDHRYVLMDRDLWYRIGLIGKIEYVPGLLAYARTQPSFWHTKSSRVAAECVEIIKKFYDQPQIPEAIRRRKRRALSNAYLRGTEYAWISKDFRTIFWYCVLAILKDPTNLRGAWGRLRHFASAGAAERKFYKRLFLSMELMLFPLRAFRNIKQWKSFLSIPKIPNLAGDRDIEWSWVASHIPQGPGEALDFGPGESMLGLIAAQKGFRVTAIDRQQVHWKYVHPELRYVQGDILQLSLPLNYFDLVINCSTVEHVGLAGRYGVRDQNPDGDLEAMNRLEKIMKPGAVMLLTIPVGLDAVFAPLCRIYGEKRLPLLLKGFSIEKEDYWTKNDQNQWIPCNRERALNFKASAGSWDPLQNSYALGCFVLRRVGYGKE